MMISQEQFALCFNSFGDSVQDSFGASIMEDVFAPIAVELQNLVLMDEKIEQQNEELRMRAEEAEALQ